MKLIIFCIDSQIYTPQQYASHCGELLAFRTWVLTANELSVLYTLRCHGVNSASILIAVHYAKYAIYKQGYRHRVTLLVEGCIA